MLINLLRTYLRPYTGALVVVVLFQLVGTIANLPTGAAGPFGRDVPRDPVIIEKMTVVPAKK